MANVSPWSRAANAIGKDRPHDYKGRVVVDPQSGNTVGFTKNTWSWKNRAIAGMGFAAVFGWAIYPYDTNPITSQAEAGKIPVMGAEKVGQTANLGVHIVGNVLGAATSELRKFAGTWVQLGRHDSAPSGGVNANTSTTLPGNVVPPTTVVVPGATLIQGTHRVTSPEGSVYDVICDNATLGEIAGGSPENAMAKSFAPFDADGNGVVDPTEGTWKVRQAIVAGGFVVDTGRPQGTLEVYSGVPIALQIGKPACTFIQVV